MLIVSVNKCWLAIFATAKYEHEYDSHDFLLATFFMFNP